ncbi:uncharacterized protein LOC131622387 [Vicia villosa]|uniref:uncharacterized protein LOC131622387 n=1 Tax=Vicia villosa TaxID=3911 RepID=UPI00273AE0B3|nr:uncharacterized protein LOC131622387 [Vicia villosa]
MEVENDNGGVQNPPPPPPPLVESSNLMTANSLPTLHQSHRLNGKNYFSWAQFMRANLKGRGKLNHIEGDPLPATDPGFTLWDNEDSLIMSWMWNSMIPEISSQYMFLPTARDIWENLMQTYSKKQDLSARFDLKNKIFNTKQGTMTVSEYFATMKGYWIELDQYQTLKMETANDTIALNTCIETDRIFEFLAGLNSDYDPIRVQILGKDRLPPLAEVFSIVRGEESRRDVMLGNKPSEGTALVANIAGKQPASKTGRDDRYCDHCKRTGHTKDRCFKLHGKNHVLNRSGGFKGIRQSQAHAATMSPDTGNSKTVENDSLISTDDLNRLKSLLESLSKPSGSCSLVMTGSSNGSGDWGM